MKLVFLYGPPGVGKLTIAKELSKSTGYKVFHNHLTTDLVRSIFPRGTKDEDAEALIYKYRLELIEAAAAKNVDLIFTFVYAKTLDDWFVKKVVKNVEKHKGKVCFVKITCSLAELAKRIKHPSRKNFQKIKRLKTLREVLHEHDVFSNVPNVDSLAIENTVLSPRQAAQRIKKYFKL